MANTNNNTWVAYEVALAEFNRKNCIDWTSRELQDNTAAMLADRAFEIDARNADIARGERLKEQRAADARLILRREKLARQ